MDSKPERTYSVALTIRELILLGAAIEAALLDDDLAAPVRAFLRTVRDKVYGAMSNG